MLRIDQLLPGGSCRSRRGVVPREQTTGRRPSQPRAPDAIRCRWVTSGVAARAGHAAYVRPVDPHRDRRAVVGLGGLLDQVARVGRRSTSGRAAPGRRSEYAAIASKCQWSWPACRSMQPENCSVRRRSRARWNVPSRLRSTCTTWRALCSRVPQRPRRSITSVSEQSDRGWPATRRTATGGRPPCSRSAGPGHRGCACSAAAPADRRARAEGSTSKNCADGGSAVGPGAGMELEPVIAIVVATSSTTRDRIPPTTPTLRCMRPRYVRQRAAR